MDRPTCKVSRGPGIMPADLILVKKCSRRWRSPILSGTLLRWKTDRLVNARRTRQSPVIWLFSSFVETLDVPEDCRAIREPSRASITTECEVETSATRAMGVQLTRPSSPGFGRASPMGGVRMIFLICWNMMQALHWRGRGLCRGDGSPEYGCSGSASGNASRPPGNLRCTCGRCAGRCNLRCQHG